MEVIRAISGLKVVVFIRKHTVNSSVFKDWHDAERVTSIKAVIFEFIR